MKDFVKKIYGSIAKRKKKCCCGPNTCSENTVSISEKIGYNKDELASIPQEADMGLGCGNPAALASLKEGETVVDLGSGGGIDAFLAAHRVGPRGRIIGIDMTEEMLEKARNNAQKGNYKNVEFKLGDIEQIPLADNIADCVISNCVINLATDKQKAFNEAFRILKPGGRLMISDMVLVADLPEQVLKSAQLYAGCIAGALKKTDYLGKIRKSGFSEVNVLREDSVRLTDYTDSDKAFCSVTAEVSDAEISLIDKAVVSVKVAAKK